MSRNLIPSRKLHPASARQDRLKDRIMLCSAQTKATATFSGVAHYGAELSKPKGGNRRHGHDPWIRWRRTTPRTRNKAFSCMCDHL